MATMTEELHGWRRYAVVFLGMLLTAALCALAIPFSMNPRGAAGPTALQAESAVPVVSAIIVCFGLATGIAGYVGRLINGAVGLFVLGVGLSVLAWRWETIEELAFSEGSLGLVGLETALWAGILFAATVGVLKMAGPLRDMVPDESDSDIVGGEWGGWGLRGVAAGILVLPVVWLIARSELKGQVLAAVVLGSMLVGLCGRFLSPYSQPRLLVAAPCLFGALGHVIGMVLLKQPLVEAYVTQSIPALSLPMPIDYAAGSLLGVSMGLGWAKSFQQQEQEQEPEPGNDTARPADDRSVLGFLVVGTVLFIGLRVLGSFLGG